MECETPLESFKKELQVCFKPHPNRRFKQRVMTSQSPGIGTVSGLLLGSPGTKSHSNVGAMKRHKEYYMGEGGGFPRIRAMVSTMSPKLLATCPNIKGALESELTNLLVGFDTSPSK